MKSGSFSLDPARTYVAGILNLTPDSFSDGGVYEKEGPLKIVGKMAPI